MSRDFRTAAVSAVLHCLTIASLYACSAHSNQAPIVAMDPELYPGDTIAVTLEADGSTVSGQVREISDHWIQIEGHIILYSDVRSIERIRLAQRPGFPWGNLAAVSATIGMVAAFAILPSDW